MRCHRAASQRPSAVWHCHKLPATSARHELIETALFIGRLPSGQPLNITWDWLIRGQVPPETERDVPLGRNEMRFPRKSDKRRSSSLCNYTKNERRRWQYANLNAFHHIATATTRISWKPNNNAHCLQCTDAVRFADSFSAGNYRCSVLHRVQINAYILFYCVFLLSCYKKLSCRGEKASVFEILMYATQCCPTNLHFTIHVYTLCLCLFYLTSNFCVFLT